MKQYIFITYNKKYIFVTNNRQYSDYKLYKLLKQYFPDPYFVAVTSDPEGILHFSDVTNLDNVLQKYKYVVDKIVHILQY